MSMRAAWASFAVAVTDSNTANDILALRSMRRRAAMRRNVPVRMLLTARVC